MLYAIPRLPHEMFLALRDLLYKWTGVFYEEKKSYLLENRLSRRLRELKLKTFEEYYSALVKGPEAAAEREVFIDILTTHETYFFRNMPQLNVFLKKALPSVIGNLKRSGGRALRLWSAACSSGEEAYTLVMMMDMNGAVPDGMDISVLASDISSDSLKKAREGIYDRYSVRAVPEKYLKKYFTQLEGPAFRLDEAARAGVRLDKINLADERSMARARNMDVVFLRNVLIYFDEATRKRVISHVARAMKPGGVLLIGHSESLHGISDQFELVIENGAPLYVKKGR